MWEKRSNCSPEVEALPAANPFGACVTNALSRAWLLALLVLVMSTRTRHGYDMRHRLKGQRKGEPDEDEDRGHPLEGSNGAGFLMSPLE